MSRTLEKNNNYERMNFNALHIMNLQIQMHLDLGKRTPCYHDAWEVMNNAMVNQKIH